jgi:fanconi-associated nuclease 1
LSTICKLFCEDYKGRRSGGPDLFIWKAEEQLCKFVEVKGPGDTPQENQKLWFDALLRANAAVEICKVVDIATDNKGKKRKAKTPASSSRKKKHAQLVESDSEDEQLNREQEQELLVKADSHPRPGKRRRLTKPEDMDDLSFYQPTPLDLSPSISGVKGHFNR